MKQWIRDTYIWLLLSNRDPKLLTSIRYKRHDDLTSVYHLSTKMSSELTLQQWIDGFGGSKI